MMMMMTTTMTMTMMIITKLYFFMQEFKLSLGSTPIQKDTN